MIVDSGLVNNACIFTGLSIIVFEPVSNFDKTLVGRPSLVIEIEFGLISSHIACQHEERLPRNEVRNGSVSRQSLQRSNSCF